ncbi:MAG TPA: hypothetical protein VHK69_18885, partial [Chitinophagaceae bacterium]|nr:hypothetical protein [Chitinophagaceae bacterium]
MSFVLCLQRAAAQAHGLNFASHEVVADYRTSLNLSPGEAICFNQDFELSFDLAFRPDCKDYFGYIFRMNRADKKNIDLIYEFKPVGSAFKIIIGDRISSITFQLDSQDLYKGWTNIRLRFNQQLQQLELTAGGKKWVEKNTDLGGRE